MKFELGQVGMTASVDIFLKENNLDPLEVMIPLIDRHRNGDWGDVNPLDGEANNDALKCGARILSVYKIKEEKIYIITEADRSSTVVLFANEY